MILIAELGSHTGSRLPVLHLFSGTWVSTSQALRTELLKELMAEQYCSVSREDLVTA